MFKLRNAVFCLALVAAHAGAEDLFKAGGLAGWELVTTPAATLAEVVTLRTDGVIAVAGTPAGFFATLQSYRNYQLHFEWRWDGKPGNAGVLLHISPGPMDRVWPLSLQVQTKHGSVGDLLPMAGAAFAEPLTSAAGAAVPLKARMAQDSEKPTGEWNICDVVAHEGRVEVRINGVAQNVVRMVEPQSGRIGFQLEGVPYELRKVVLTPSE